MGQIDESKILYRERSQEAVSRIHFCADKTATEVAIILGFSNEISELCKTDPVINKTMHSLANGTNYVHVIAALLDVVKNQREEIIRLNNF